MEGLAGYVGIRRLTQGRGGQGGRGRQESGGVGLGEKS